MRRHHQQLYGWPNRATVTGGGLYSEPGQLELVITRLGRGPQPGGFGASWNWPERARPIPLAPAIRFRATGCSPAFFSPAIRALRQRYRLRFADNQPRSVSGCCVVFGLLVHSQGRQFDLQVESAVQPERDSGRPAQGIDQAFLCCHRDGSSPLPHDRTLLIETCREPSRPSQ